MGKRLIAFMLMVVMITSSAMPAMAAKEANELDRAIESEKLVEPDEFVKSDEFVDSDELNAPAGGDEDINADDTNGEDSSTVINGEDDSGEVADEIDSNNEINSEITGEAEVLSEVSEESATPLYADGKTRDYDEELPRRLSYFDVVDMFKINGHRIINCDVKYYTDLYLKNGMEQKGKRIFNEEGYEVGVIDDEYRFMFNEGSYVSRYMEGWNLPITGVPNDTEVISFHYWPYGFKTQKNFIDAQIKSVFNTEMTSMREAINAISDGLYDILKDNKKYKLGGAIVYKYSDYEDDVWPSTTVVFRWDDSYIIVSEEYYYGEPSSDNFILSVYFSNPSKGPSIPSTNIEPTGLKYNGKFNYSFTSGFDVEKTNTLPYNMDFSWFDENNSDEYTVKTHNLAKMAIRVSMAAMDQKGVDRGKNITKLFEDMEFDKNQIYKDYPLPSKSSIGYAFAHKRVVFKEGTYPTDIIFVAVRGGGYEDEWYSNMTIGTAAEHEGFSDAANKINKELAYYLNELRLDEKEKNRTKIMISGYSRGAAVSNILGHLINIDIENGITGLDKKNVYTFCFECPRTVRNARKYNDENIYSIINQSDFVTHLVWKDGNEWDFNRYGRRLTIPALFNQEKIKYDSQYEYMQYKLGEILKAAGEENKLLKYSDSIEKGSRVKRLFVVDELLSQLTVDQIFYVQSGLQGILANIICNFMVDKDADSLAEEFRNIGDHAKLVAINIAKRTLMNTAGYQIFKIIKTYGLDMQFTYHYPEVCLAWMDSLSSTELMSDKATYGLIFNCPVDITVYDKKTKELIGEVINDKETENNELYAATIDYDGQKVVYLPSNGSYEIKVAAREDATVTAICVKWEEINENALEVTTHYNIDMKKGEIVTATIDESNYRISNSEGIIPYDEKQTEGSIKLYKTDVSVIGNGTYISGKSVYKIGEFAKLEALPFDGEEFLGWYDSETDKLLSKDQDYRYMVSKGKITAKFTANGPSDDNDKDDDKPKPGKKDKKTGKNRSYDHSHSFSLSGIDTARIIGYDGLPIVKCSCGATATTAEKSSLVYGIWLNEISAAISGNAIRYTKDWKIENRLPIDFFGTDTSGNGITIETDTWHSINKKVLNAIDTANRPVTFSFKYKGDYYKFTIPAGANVSSQVADEYIGLINLGGRYGIVKVPKGL